MTYYTILIHKNKILIITKSTFKAQHRILIDKNFLHSAIQTWSYFRKDIGKGGIEGGDC